MKSILKSRTPKRLIGLKVHQDGFKPITSLKVAECGSLHEIEANVNSLVHEIESPWN